MNIKDLLNNRKVVVIATSALVCTAGISASVAIAVNVNSNTSSSKVSGDQVVVNHQQSGDLDIRNESVPVAGIAVTLEHLTPETDPADKDYDASTTDSTQTETSSENTNKDLDDTTETQTVEATEETTQETTEERNPKETVLDNYSNLGVVSDVNNYLNVRDGASTDSNVIGKVIKYGGVEILEDCQNGWFKIEFPYTDNGYGYVNSDFVDTGDSAKQIAIDNAMLMVNVKAQKLNVREKPSTDFDVLTQLSANEKYQVTDVLDGWVEITLGTNESDGSESKAYLSSDFVKLGYFLSGPIEFNEAAELEASINPVRTELVNFAIQYLGGTYVWGGTTLGVGVDCSGFTQQVYAHFGYTLNRCSYDQAVQGTEVTPETMKPGDLIFYSRPGYVIGHVGIYIGNGQVIHAYNPSQGIIITAFDYATPIKIMNIIGE